MFETCNTMMLQYYACNRYKPLNFICCVKIVHLLRYLNYSFHKNKKHAIGLTWKLKIYNIKL